MNRIKKTHKFSIMVVEDERLVATDLTRRLVSLGYDICGVVSNGENAIIMARAEKPDIIIMDINLQGEMDGIATAQAINKEQFIPVIYLTSYSDEHTIQRAKISEPYGYLLKPFEAKDLRSSIEIAVHKAESHRRLKEHEQWLATTLTCIGEAVIATDVNGNIKFMNSMAANLIGTPMDDCIGKPIDTIYVTEYEYSNELLLMGMNKSFESIASELFKYKNLKNSANEQILIEETAKDIVDKSGEFLGRVISFKDVRGKVSQAIEIISARNYYLSLLEDFPAMIWRADTNGRFNFFNGTWATFRGKRIEEEINYQWLDGIHDDERDVFKEKFKMAFSQKVELRIEFKLKNRYNEYKWVYCAAVPFYNQEQTFDGYIGVCLDINDRKKMEEDLKESKIIAENSAKAKSEFISNISHEIKTPLNHILGLSDLLSAPNLNSEQKEYISIIKKSGRELMEILNGILNYSNLGSGKVELKQVHFSLDRMLHDMVYSFLPGAKERNILMDYYIAPEVPEIIIGDKEKFKDIIQKLLDNALKFTEKGRVCIEINKEDGEEDNVELHFVISDTGIGIPPVQLNSIFNPFTQVDGSITRKYGGTGLGLSIVMQTINLLNGKIWAESSYGKGSKFHFIIKVKKSVKTKNYIYR